MITIQVYDPPMCCSTGVCGPSVDPVLPRFAADLEWLKDKGVLVERYNLAQQVAAFTENKMVQEAIQAQGVNCLPMVLVDGRVIASGSYPSRKELAEHVGVDYEPAPASPAQHQSGLVGIALGKQK